MIVDHPRQCQGTCSKARGDCLSKGANKGRKKVFAVFLWGVLSGFILLSQSLTVKANSLSYHPKNNDEIPDQIIEYCELVGTEFQICPELLEAIAYHESRFIPTVTNGKHIGLMQINVKIHAKRIEKYGWTEADMTDPYKNLMVAADYLSELYELYGDENPIVLSVYSGNWKAVNKYKEYGIMCDYANEVLTRSAEYERLHAK